MLRFTSTAQIPADFGPTAVTIGKFDGVHTGHRAVLDQLSEVSVARSLTSTVVTFDRHPLALLHSDLAPTALVSTAQKLDFLERWGVEATLVLTFDESVSGQTPEDFVQHTLVDALQARVVLVGADFKFGLKGAGNVELLKRLGLIYGFEVLVVDDIRRDAGRRVSSTWIRELLAAGAVEEAATLLGGFATVRSVVVEGEHRGRELGYPTANLDPNIEGFIPADGVYAALLVVDGRAYGAAVSVGNNPTFEGVPAKQVEAHALDQDFDLYGKLVEVRFIAFIRGMQKFTGVDALVEQMVRDEADVRTVLASTSRQFS
jgi:riboflavin kinase/FMN adenylyltransferase